MAFEDPGKCVSLVAGADLSASQYRFVSLDGSGKAVRCGDGADAVGVLQNAPASGKIATVMVGAGITKVKAGAATTNGALVASDNAARAIDAAVSGDRVLGRFLEAATGADQVVSMLWQKEGGTYV